MKGDGDGDGYGEEEEKEEEEEEEEEEEDEEQKWYLRKFLKRRGNGTGVACTDRMAWRNTVSVP